MSADREQILGDLSTLLRTVSDAIPPGEDVTMETKVIDDLGLESIALAALSGRLQARFGASANLTTFLSARAPIPLRRARVGDIVDLIADVLDGTEAGGGSQRGPLREAPRSEPERRPAADARHADDGNTAVLAEYAPGAARSLLRLPRGDVEVFTAGDGPALIMMHPINAGAGVFARQFADLAENYQVICVHQPGVGTTTWDADISLPGLARLCRTVLTELSVNPPFHVIGSSFGGLVAQEFTLLHPRDCASLVLVGCSYQPGSRRSGIRVMSAVIRKELDEIGRAGETGKMSGSTAELERILLRCESMDPGAGLAYLEAFASRPSTYTRLPEISVPTMVLRGQLDTVIREKAPYVLYGAIPSAQFAEIPGAGHFPYLTHPSAFNAIVEPFLSAHQAGDGPSPDSASAWPARAASRGPFAAAAANGPAAGRLPRPDECAIIINTGRCGSTLLSHLIATKQDTLSASESMGSIRRHLLYTPLAPLTGAQYWTMLSAETQQGSVMSNAGIVPKEYAYPENGRFGSVMTNVPPILRVMLPLLSDEPDTLFDELAERVPRFPEQSLGAQHKMMLDTLAAMMGKRRWVERTGASCQLTYAWLSACPDARVVYLTRDISATARSMSRHPSFQLDAIRLEFQERCGVDPYLMQPDGTFPTIPDVPPELRQLQPGDLTADALRDHEIQIEVFEQMCANLLGCADQALADLQPRHLHRVRYEDLTADPLTELTRLGEFLGFADPDEWAASCAPRVIAPRSESPVRA